MSIRGSALFQLEEAISCSQIVVICNVQFDSILKNITKHISPSKGEMEFFISLLEYRELEKNEFLLREDQPCRFISYVDKGAFRAFHINPEGKETTIMFAIDDWWVTDMYLLHSSKTLLAQYPGAG